MLFELSGEERADQDAPLPQRRPRSAVAALERLRLAIGAGALFRRTIVGRAIDRGPIGRRVRRAGQGWEQGAFFRRVVVARQKVHVAEDRLVELFDASRGLADEQVLAFLRLVDGLGPGGAVDGIGPDEHQRQDDGEEAKVDEEDVAGEPPYRLFHDCASVNLIDSRSTEPAATRRRGRIRGSWP